MVIIIILQIIFFIAAVALLLSFLFYLNTSLFKIYKVPTESQTKINKHARLKNKQIFLGNLIIGCLTGFISILLLFSIRIIYIGVTDYQELLNLLIDTLGTSFKPLSFIVTVTMSVNTIMKLREWKKRKFIGSTSV